MRHTDDTAFGFAQSRGPLADVGQPPRIAISRNKPLAPVRASPPPRRAAQPQLARRTAVTARRGSARFDNRRRGDGRRPNRVSELIRREVGGIIDSVASRSRSLHRDPATAAAASTAATAAEPTTTVAAAANADADPSNIVAAPSRGVLISVVDVRCSDDLRTARISVSVLGSDTQRTDAFRWLRRSQKEIRYELANSVYLKFVPELSFVESDMAKAAETVNVLNRLSREREQKQSEIGGSMEESKVVRGFGNEDLDLDVSADDGLIDDDEEEDDEEFLAEYGDWDEDGADGGLRIIEVDGDDEDEQRGSRVGRRRQARS